MGVKRCWSLFYSIMLSPYDSFKLIYQFLKNIILMRYILPNNGCVVGLYINTETNGDVTS